MPKVFTSKHQKIGELGEDIAERYLKNKGFIVIERNYTRKCGEIDIVAKKGNRTHFIEVKAVNENITESSEFKGHIRPEDNMHPKKLERFSRTVEVYLAEHVLYKKDMKDTLEESWQCDLVSVFIDKESKKAKVSHMENIIF